MFLDTIDIYTCITVAAVMVSDRHSGRVLLVSDRTNCIMRLGMEM